jgi:chromate transporter
MPDSDQPSELSAAQKFRTNDSAATPPDADGGTPPRPSLGELVLTLVRISVLSFGGVLPWARRALVDDERWMTAEEFNKLFAICHFLPGPNVVNMSAVFGLRLYGVIGAIVALVALCAVPVALMIVLGMLYDRYGTAPGISGAVAGLAAGVAGLIIATALNMAGPLLRRRSAVELGIAAVAFAAIALLRLPLFPVLAVLVPLSVALAWGRRA